MAAPETTNKPSLQQRVLGAAAAAHHYARTHQAEVVVATMITLVGVWLVWRATHSRAYTPDDATREDAPVTAEQVLPSTSKGTVAYEYVVQPSNRDNFASVKRVYRTDAPRVRVGGTFTVIKDAAGRYVDETAFVRTALDASRRDMVLLGLFLCVVGWTPVLGRLFVQRS